MIKRSPYLKTFFMAAFLHGNAALTERLNKRKSIVKLKMKNDTSYKKCPLMIASVMLMCAVFMDEGESLHDKE